MIAEMHIEEPNEKQKLFLRDRHRHVAFGGARGGGKSWAVRTKAKLLCLRYPGIKVLIVRQTYKELQNNHIDPLSSIRAQSMTLYSWTRQHSWTSSGSERSLSASEAQTTSRRESTTPATLVGAGMATSSDCL